MGQLVAVDSGNGATELGTVRSVVNRDGKDFLVFESIDNSGVATRSEIDATAVTNLLTAKELDGKQIQAVTQDGQVLSGIAIAAATATGSAGVLVQGVRVGLDRIVSVSLI